jgi:HrpA-like RNA helicase
MLADLSNLPVSEALPELNAALSAGLNVVLVAPAGAGKTTLVPLVLLAAPWRCDGRILMLEPRRLATRAGAARMAELVGEPVGKTIGYRTRLDRNISEATRIEVVTEGLLVAAGDNRWHLQRHRLPLSGWPLVAVRVGDDAGRHGCAGVAHLGTITSTLPSA